MSEPALTYEDLDQVGPHVKCAAQIERLDVEPFEFIECRLSPADGHTVHRSPGDCFVWERVERPLR
jgi:hypothetical protein